MILRLNFDQLCSGERGAVRLPPELVDPFHAERSEAEVEGAAEAIKARSRGTKGFEDVAMFYQENSTMLVPNLSQKAIYQRWSTIGVEDLVHYLHEYSGRVLTKERVGPQIS